MFTIPFFNFNKKHTIKPTVLVILDGFGQAPASNGNAIELARTPHIDYFREHYPNGTLIASGEAVGLPTNEVGNTEVGHLTIGSGRVILQDLKRINLAIENGSFYDNVVLSQISEHVQKNNSRLHILGLVSSGKVHSSIDHLYALLHFAKEQHISEVLIHVFTDGRDAPPKEALEVIAKLEKFCETLGVGKIASISGRYYAMDRDRRWPRIKKTYTTIVEGGGQTAKNAEEAIKNAYAKGQSDEFIEPTLIVANDAISGNSTSNTINDNDAVIFFNYRIDRAKQLTMAIALPDFENIKNFDFGHDPVTNKKLDDSSNETFHRSKVSKNLFFATMTEYDKNLPVSGILYKSDVVVTPLCEVISKANLKQMHMAESEKERFVTFYFDGLREEPQVGEERSIVASPKVSTYDRQPEMSLPQLVHEFKKNLAKDVYHFFVLNFANADMVAHTGNLSAAMNAIETIDKQLNDLVSSVLRCDGTVIVTADHGNAEEMLTFPSSTFFYTSQSGIVNTDHSNNPVPVYVIRNDLFDIKVPIGKGQLSDVAPTILNVLGLPVPSVITGKNLLEGLTINTNEHQ
jgi:2,3-bisphosphoglycerate-independent phosphoglycerate mutase